LKVAALKWAPSGVETVENRLLYTVELGRDVAGGEVQDLANIGRVLEQDARVEAALHAGLPFGNLLPILKQRVKDVGWAIPHMGALEMPTVGETGAAKDFNWGELRHLLGHMVPKIDCMVQRRWPEV
jgi:hypothetical protein